jgi:hypothetical protein
MKVSPKADRVEIVILSFVIASMVALMLTSRVVAAELPPRTGERINLLTTPPTTMPANQPFWLGHGWCTQDTDEDPILLALNPDSRVEFTIDGTPVTTATDVEFGGTTALGAPCVVLKTNYYNARFGLDAGTHTFTGCWYLLGELQFCRAAEIQFE